MKSINVFIFAIVSLTVCAEVSQAETCVQIEAVRQVVIRPPTGGANAAMKSLC